ncbi:MAG: HAD family phosphatase [Candidatus Lambdaproteobacteria bacterium]|nr:HAD family phosphatase [Candidatus Lambdaproteobacteria bacterium]
MPELRLPKLIVTDLDGTLLPESKAITPYALEVLRRLREKGVRLGIATGKFYHLAQPYAAALGPETAVIALDGARTSLMAEGPSRVRGIPRAEMVGLLRWLDAPGVELFLDSGEDELLLRFERADFPLLTRHWAERKRRVADAHSQVVGDSGILSFVGAAEPAEAVAAGIERRFASVRTSVFYSSALACQRFAVQPRAVTKGSALRELCAGLAIEPSECLAFGDWYNDVHLFRAGAVNVAMQNAVAEVKALAHHITDCDCEHDGVARFLAAAFL